jgi:ankyrin repeat protein
MMASKILDAMIAVCWHLYPQRSVLSQDELLSLCKSEDESTLLQVLAKNPMYNLNCIDSDGYSPLTLVCIKGWTEAVDLLIKAEGISETINSQNFEGKTALWWACYLKYERIVASLLSVQELDTNLCEKNGISPLIISIMRESPGVSRLLINDQRTLLNQALPPNLVIEECKLGGNTPLILAVRQKCLPTVRALLDDPRTVADLTMSDNMSAFILACVENEVDIAAELLKKEIDVNRTIDSCTVLMYASGMGFAGIVRLLLNDPKSRVNVNLIGDKGINALILATRGGHIECVRLLVAVPGIEVNRTFLYGFTALAGAVVSGREDIAQVLRDAGAKNDASLITRLASWGLNSYMEKLDKFFSSFSVFSNEKK